MFTGQISPNNFADPASLQQLGYEMLMNNQYEEALKYFQTNVLYHPDCIPAYIDLAQALLEKAATRSDHFTKALEILNIALELDPENALIYKIISEAYADQSIFNKAYEYAEKAYKLKPDQVLIAINYANNLKFRAELKQAAELYRQMINQDRKNIYAYYNLFLIEKITADTPELKQCEFMATKYYELDINKQVYLFFALSKAYADLKDHQKSFEYLAKANKLKRQGFNDYNVKRDVGAFAALQNTFTDEIMNSELAAIYHAYQAGDSEGVNKLLGINLADYPTPIFILGMPRSGSTLIEQILSAHSQVDGAGELNYFRQACSGIVINDVNTLLKQMTLSDLKTRAISYLEAIKKHGEGAAYITDKMPGNFVYLGFIKLMLPHAKIIHSRRDPIATCFSCYKQLFENSHPYSFDLSDLGQYYSAYSKLMQYYSDFFKNDINPILDMDYEDLVNDQVANTESILQHCGLSFEQACIEFHTNKRVVNTASFVQVRKPIYSSSKSEWADYKNYLQDLFYALAISP